MTYVNHFLHGVKVRENSCNLKIQLKKQLSAQPSKLSECHARLDKFHPIVTFFYTLFIAHFAYYACTKFDVDVTCPLQLVFGWLLFLAKKCFHRCLIEWFCKMVG